MLPLVSFQTIRNRRFNQAVCHLLESRYLDHGIVNFAGIVGGKIDNVFWLAWQMFFHYEYAEVDNSA